MEICLENPVFVKIEKIRHFIWRPNYVLLLPDA